MDGDGEEDDDQGEEAADSGQDVERQLGLALGPIPVLKCELTAVSVVSGLTETLRLVLNDETVGLVKTEVVTERHLAPLPSPAILAVTAGPALPSPTRAPHTEIGTAWI